MNTLVQIALVLTVLTALVEIIDSKDTSLQPRGFFYNPCARKRCSENRVCKVVKWRAVCVSKVAHCFLRPCPKYRYKIYRSVCGSDGKTYRNLCQFARENCKRKTTIKFVKYGRCPKCNKKEPLQCLVPACFIPSCPAYPKAICVAVCACQSQYYYKGRRVNCYRTPPPNPCNSKFCGTDGICKSVNGKAVCVLKRAVCSLRKDVGPCRARIPRYFFNSVRQQCERFNYGGCHGNGNNFRSRKRCEDTCKPDQDVCSLPPVAGPCEALIKRYFHNATSGKCEEFYYGGCRGNDNNFKTITACERKCQRAGNPCALTFCGVNGKCKLVNGKAICISPGNPCRKVKCSAGTRCVVENGKPLCRPEVCLLPREPGPCKGSFIRYYYSRISRKCQTFIYGGCLGNGNNFKNQLDCQSKCEGQGLVDPCIATTCRTGSKCIPVNGKGVCVPLEPLWLNCHYISPYKRRWIMDTVPTRSCPTRRNPCNKVKCSAGTRCVVVNGKPFCRPDMCLLPSDRGPCKANLKRYFYNTTSKDCESFVYGGCPGNKNNFQNKIECENQCKGVGE